MIPPHVDLASRTTQDANIANAENAAQICRIAHNLAPDLSLNSFETVAVAQFHVLSPLSTREVENAKNRHESSILSILNQNVSLRALDRMLPGSQGVEARSNHEAAAATAEKESEFSDLAPAHIGSHRMIRSRSRRVPQPQAGSTQLSPNVKIGAHAGEAAPSFTADNNQRTPANGHFPFGSSFTPSHCDQM